MRQTWSPESWRELPAAQQPEWDDPGALDRALKELRNQPPLVFAGEARALKESLGMVSRGEAFVLQAGCALWLRGRVHSALTPVQGRARDLGITNVDPLKYELLFERFLNPDRVSMPDIDIDFSDDRRDMVIEYVKNKYGSDSVSQIITFGTLSTRAVLKDVGRVVGVPLNVIESITKAQGRPILLVEAFASVIPSDLWITGFEEKSLQLKITGSAFSTTAIADFMANLRASGKFKEVDLVISRRDLARPTPLVTFEVTCRYEG